MEQAQAHNPIANVGIASAPSTLSAEPTRRALITLLPVWVLAGAPACLDENASHLHLAGTLLA